MNAAAVVIKKLKTAIEKLKRQIAVGLGNARKYILKLIDAENKLELIQSPPVSLKPVSLFKERTMFDTSGIRMVRLDFKDVESRKAVKKVAEFLKNNAEEFELEPGETYQSVAEGLVCDVIRAERFIDSSIPIHEIIVSAVLGKLEALNEDESYASESEVAEPDIEDALHYVESLAFQGSEKQIKWAKDIALKNIDEVARALKLNRSIPVKAKWWIDNRSNISL
jgi:hypothetical protein